jgi:hypothetical protein
VLLVISFRHRVLARIAVGDLNLVDYHTACLGIPVRHQCSATPRRHLEEGGMEPFGSCSHQTAGELGCGMLSQTVGGKALELDP